MGEGGVVVTPDSPSRIDGRIAQSAADIQKTQTRVALVTAALDLLWKHDEAHARANFVKVADVLTNRFASDAIQKNERAEIRATILIIISTL